MTYWLTVGDQVIRNKFDKRMAEIRLGLTGQIPDGLLFRISSIDDDPARAFAMQQTVRRRHDGRGVRRDAAPAERPGGAGSAS